MKNLISLFDWSAKKMYIEKSGQRTTKVEQKTVISEGGFITSQPCFYKILDVYLWMATIGLDGMSLIYTFKGVNQCLIVWSSTQMFQKLV